MRRIGLAIALMLAGALGLWAQNQNSNTVTVTVVAVPSAPVISVTPTNFYQSTATTLTINVASGGVSSACTGTWDSTPLTLTFTAGPPIKFTAPVTVAMTATLGNHSVVISCPLPTLSLNSPVELPLARPGQAYSANLAQLSKLSGGVPPYTFSLASGSLPTGLSLSSSGVVSGTPSGAGYLSFSYKVTDSSGA